MTTTTQMIQMETYKRRWTDRLHCETPNGNEGYELWDALAELRIFEIRDTRDNVHFRIGRGRVWICNKSDEDGSVVEGDILIPSYLEQWQSYEWANAWVTTQQNYLNDSFTQAAEHIQTQGISDGKIIYRTIYKYVYKDTLKCRSWESWDVTSQHDSSDDMV